MRGLSGAVVPSCEGCALFVTKRHGWDRIETGDWPSLFTAIFFPVSFSGFGHFFRGVAEPAGFSALEIAEDFSSLALGAEVNIRGFRAHGVEQGHFVAFFWKILDFDGICVGRQAAYQPAANHFLIGVV